MGLGDYVEVFVENRIDFDVLSELAEADLRELGLALGDRKRLLKAIDGFANKDIVETPAAEIATPNSVVGERRQVAVLFADISGFTTLSSQRDAEEIHQMLNHFFAAVDDVVQRFGGSVDKHIGDAVMAVFGAPVAHTDDPERAVRAALAVHDAAAELDPPMRVHAGVAAGQVVASNTGSAAHLEYTVTGETVNLASRLTDLATAGETLISGVVHDALNDRLDGEDLGKKSLPGRPNPVGVWRVNGLGEARVYAEGQFIGRAAELATFNSALDAAVRNSQGETLFIRGEAGIGKTRLLHEYQRLSEERGFQSHGGQVLDFGVGEGQDAVRVLLRSLLGLTPGAGQNVRTTAAERIIDDGLIGPELRLHLYDLLSLPQGEMQRPLYEAMDVQQRNLGRIETLVSLAAALADKTPLLLRVEDLHWAQPTLLRYLTALVGVAARHPIILLLTSRLQGDPLDAAWRAGIGAAPITTLDLGPLNADEARNLVFDFEGVDADWAAACIERSGGNPLFLDQLLRSSDGTDGADGQAIPGSVQSVVQSRIDALIPQDRTALQAASVLGLRFALDALRFVMGDSAYQPDNLLQFNLIRRSEGAFQFYHALFRDAVHGSFLKGRRQELHLKAADWYQDRDAVLYAEHLGEAGSERAPIAFQRAARAEAEAYRIERALELVERGLGLLGECTDRFDLAAHRADLLRELGRPEEALDAWEEASNLAMTDRQRCLAWIGVAAVNRLMSWRERGTGALEQAEAIARREGMEVELAEIYCYRGGAAFVAGDFEQCLNFHNESLRHARLGGSYRWEATALGGIADAEYGRGRMRNAADSFERCFALCRAHGLLDIESRNRFMMGVTRRYVDGHDVAMEEFRAAGKMAEDVHNVRAAMMANMLSGEVLIDMADFEGAEPHLQDAVRVARSLSNKRMELYCLYELSRRALGLRQTDRAIEIMNEVMAIGRETGINFHGPRLFALNAVLQTDPEECRQSLAEGAALVAVGANAHNVLWFHRDAIDACLNVGDIDEARVHSQALLDFTVEEKLPWAEFFATRGQVLAECAEGKGEAAALANAVEQGRQLGLLIALPELEDALSQLA